jgi:hypothetical protein
MGTLKSNRAKKRRDLLMVSFENKEVLATIQSLLKQLGIKSKLLTEEQMEDIGLAMMMKDVDTTKTVSYEKVMKKLGA